MTEKYKIYLSEDIRTRLINDAELFEFTRSDASVNLNGFLKELIVNYFDQYRKDSEELLSGIIDDIASVRSIKSKDAAALADKIISTYIRGESSSTGGKAVITLTVSGPSYNIIKTIENNLLQDKSLSGYMKDMFTSYLSIPRSRREEIIFKDVYADIRRAIAEHKRLSLSSTSNKFNFTVEPYIIAPSKEEQCNYLLCRDVKAKKSRTFRISRIRTPFVTSDTFKTDGKFYERLRAIAARSPHTAAPDIHALIRLNEAGKRKYRLIVKNRPQVTKIDGDVYVFDWPEVQLDDYFRRFGKDAVVLKPGKLRSRLRNYYSQALEVYTGQSEEKTAERTINSRMEILRAEHEWQRAGAYSVRIEGMNRQHHITLREEFDEHDCDGTKYIVILDDGYPVATCRFYETDKDSVTLGRVVVLPEYRGKGLGSRVVTEAEKWIKELGYVNILIDSRLEAINFYEKLGYQHTDDDVVKSGNFDCVKMQKKTEQ